MPENLASWIAKKKVGAGFLEYKITFAERRKKDMTEEKSKGKKDMTEEKSKEKKDGAKEKNSKIYRFPDEAWLGGVCAGIAYKLKIQSWIPRLAWTLSVVVLGFGILPYILCWIFMPAADTPEDYDDVCG